jgi:cytochrome c55X
MKHDRVLMALLVVGALAVGLSALAQQRPQQAANAPPASAQVQKGKQLYADHCSHCHGFNMVTGGNVTFDLRTFPHNERRRFFESVTNGKDHLMPPWGDVLTQDEIGSIWAYVLTGGKP